MSFFKLNKLASIKVCVALLIVLVRESLKYLKSSNLDLLLKFFLINAESNLLSTL